MIIHPGQLDDARRLFEEGLRRQRKNVLYLSQNEEFSRLDPGQPSQTNKNSLIPDLPDLKPSPMDELRKTGGVLLLNMAEISTVFAEGNNNAIDKHGAAPLRATFLCQEHDLRNGHLSDALMDRGQEIVDLRNFSFPKFPALKFKHKEQLKNPYLIDLKEDKDGWEERLNGGLAFVGQKLEMHPGELELAKGRPVLLINPPEGEPRLQDLVMRLQHQGQKIYFAAKPDDDALRAGAEDKMPAEDIETILQNGSTNLHAVNPATIGELIDSEIVFTDNKPDKRPSILEQLEGADDEPVLYVTQSLEKESHWHRLMQHTTAFRIAAAPGVEVPEIYQDNVHQYDPDPRPLDVPLFTWPVAFLKSCDPRMVEKLHIPPDVMRIDIEPTDTSDRLISTLEPLETAGCWELKKQRLLQALIDGKKVLITGLENNPELKQELDSLLACDDSGYVNFNGQRYHFGDGGNLDGKVLVLTDSDELIQSCQGTVSHTDPIADPQKWETLALQALQNQDSLKHIPLPDLQNHFRHLLELREIAVRQELVERTDPPFNYQELETLFRHTIGLPAASNDPLSAQVRHSIFEDQLIGKLPRERHRDGASEPEQMTSYLRICARWLFPEQMEQTLPRQVDHIRLSELLAGTHHEDAILSRPWDFLECFGPDVINAVIADAGNTLEDKHALEKKMGKEVLSLVVSVATYYENVHNITLLQPWLKENADKLLQSGRLAGFFPPHTFQAYSLPALLPPSERNEKKARQLLETSNMLFVVGPPGAGKSYLANKLTKDDPQFNNGGQPANHYVLSVADYEEDEFCQQIDAFMNDPNPATLLIDEVNLLGKRALNKLREAALTSSPTKRIVGTGNDSDMEGRELPDFIRDHMPALRCEAMPAQELRKIAVDPCFADLPPQPELKNEEREKIAQYAVELYQHMQTAFPRLAQSQRSLGEYMLQLVCVMDKKSLRTWDEIKPYVNYIARQVYTDALPQSERRAAELILNTIFGEIQQNKIDEIAPIPPGLVNNALDDTPGELADTPKTRKQVRDDCWLHTMYEWRDALPPSASRPAGLRAQFKESPPGLGKDTITPATLNKLERAFSHINAKASNFDEFENEMKKAIEKRRALIVSEGKVFTSGRVEKVVNTALTQGLRGVWITFTDNADAMPGRNPRSAALQDRGMRKILPDYDDEDWPGLANHFAEDARKEWQDARQRMLPPNLPSFQVAAPPTSEEQDKMWEQYTQMVLELHRNMRKKCEERGISYKPGARRMRNAFAALAKKPASLTAQQVIEREYAIFNILAGSAVAAPAQPEDQVAAQLRLYTTILKFLTPQWRSHPRLKPLPNTTSSLPDDMCSVYHPQKNVLYIDTDQQDAKVAKHLMQAYGATRQLYNPLAQPVDILNQTLLNAARKKAQQHDHSSRTATSMRVSGRSGVGKETPKGIRGHMTHAQSARYYLAMSSSLVHHEEGVMVPVHEHAGFDNDVPPTIPNRVELFKARVEHGRIYLGAMTGMRPTQVKVNDNLLGTKVRPSTLGWFVEVPAQNGGSGQAAADGYVVTHGFVNAPALPIDPAWFKLWEINPAWPDDVQELIEQLRGEAPRSIPQEIANKVEGFLSPESKSGFEYSDEDAEELLAGSRADKITHFLHERKGVCAEFADAFAAIMTAIGYPTICTDGSPTDHGDIPIAAHRWNEVILPNGQRFTIDPTPPSFLPRTGLDDEKGNTHANSSHPSAISGSKEFSGEDKYLKKASIKDVWFQYDPHTEIVDTLKLLLRRLGLENSQSQDSVMQRVSRPTSKLDVRQYAAGQRACFIQRTTGSNKTRLKSLVLMPPAGSQWTESEGNVFQLRMALFQLRKMGIKLLDENMQQIPDEKLHSFLKDWSSNTGKADRRQQEDKISMMDMRHIKLANDRFYDDLMHQFYEVLFEKENGPVNFDDKEQVKSAYKKIAAIWESVAVENLLGILPVKLHFLPEKNLMITRSVSEEMLVDKYGHKGGDITILMEKLGMATNANIDMEDSPILKSLNAKMDDPQSFAPEELKMAREFLTNLLDPPFNPASLRRWAAEKMQKINQLPVKFFESGDFDYDLELFLLAAMGCLKSLNEKARDMRPEPELLTMLKKVLPIDEEDQDDGVEKASEELKTELKKIRNRFPDLHTRCREIERLLGQE